MGVIVRKEIELKVHVAYDSEAKCWYVAASDIPGLHLEAATAAELIERLAECAPEMIELNVQEILERANRPSGLSRMMGAFKTSRERPHVAVTPVFDSPMLACA